MLAKLNNGIEYSEKEIDKMTWQEKTKLVQKDPVTCSRYFDHSVQKFLNTTLKSDCEPIGKVKDYFHRAEFQQRGSPHIHMLVWIENAPTLEKKKKNTEEEIVQFVDQYLTCNADNKETANLVNLQTHKHSRIAERRENQYVDLDFHCLHPQEQCCYILLQRMLKRTKRNTKSFKK